MMKLSRVKLGAAAFLLATMPLLSANAAESDSANAAEFNGWYGGLELGVALSPGVTISGQDNDFASSSMCDGFHGGNPSGADCSRPGGDVGVFSGRRRTGDNWENVFDGAAGVLSGLSLGYRWGAFRLEGEYFHRTAAHDEENEPTVEGQSLSKITNEAIISSAHLGSLASHNIFINGYYDLPLRAAKTKLRPYIGAGAGSSLVLLDYSANFTRSINLEGPLAGTTTVAKETFSDNVFGYQLIAGADYPLDDRVTIGLKFRWADYGTFQVDRKLWDRLRSHASLTGPGGNPIFYGVETDDIQFWALSLGVKYRF